jgi:potassium efflux system protein
MNCLIFTNQHNLLTRRSFRCTGHRILLSLGCLLLAIFWLSDRPGWAQTAATPAQSSNAAAIDDLISKRAKIAERIAALTPAANSVVPKGEPSQTTMNLDNERDLLESLDSVYLQQQSMSEERTSLEQEKKKLAQDASALQALDPAESKSYSFVQLEDLRDQLAAEEGRAEATETDLAVTEKLLQAAREHFEECERQRRAGREALQENQNVGRQAALASELRLAELKSNVGQELVSLRRAEVEVKTARQEVSKNRRSFLQSQITRAAMSARFTQHDFETRVQLLTHAHDEYLSRLKDAERSLHQLEEEQKTSLTQLKTQHIEAAVLEVATDTFHLLRTVCCEEITLLNQRLGEMDHSKHFLNCRYQLAGGKLSPNAISQWRDEVTDTMNQRQSLQRLRTLRLQELRTDQAMLYRRVHLDAAENERLRPWLERQTAQLQRLIELYETSLLQLQTGRRSMQRLLDDLQAGKGSQSLAERLTDARKAFGTFWNYELEKVDDRPITVGKIVSGILYLFLGILLARLVSRVVGRQILPRLGFNEGANHAVQAILFYSLCVTFSLLALDLVNLPFAAFTFLGGAAAIGIGFGSQNIVNNFISGLILLAEQPLRVGDLVEIDGQTGTVEKIGARSTRLRTMANHEIVVPNSKLLEDKVTNLTLSDNLVQTTIAVTLGSSMTVEEVRHQLLAAASHPKVLSEPAPVVLLLSFNKTELSFELHFWIKLANLMECRIVESEVREAINISLAAADAVTSNAATLPSIVGSPQVAKPIDGAGAIAGRISNNQGGVGLLRKAG